MAVNSIANAGIQGINTGLRQATDAASRIAQPNLEQGLEQFTTAAVDLKSAEQQVQASAQVVKTADELVGTLLDTLA